MTEPISYASDNDTRREARPTRTLGTWVRLLIVWTTGLVVWMFYVLIIAYIFGRIFL